jgi:hypothetical protein
MSRGGRRKDIGETDVDRLLGEPGIQKPVDGRAKRPVALRQLEEPQALPGQHGRSERQTTVTKVRFDPFFFFPMEGASGFLFGRNEAVFGRRQCSH